MGSKYGLLKYGRGLYSREGFIDFVAAHSLDISASGDMGNIYSFGGTTAIDVSATGTLGNILELIASSAIVITPSGYISTTMSFTSTADVLIGSVSVLDVELIAELEGLAALNISMSVSDFGFNINGVWQQRASPAPEWSEKVCEPVIWGSVVPPCSNWDENA